MFPLLWFWLWGQHLGPHSLLASAKEPEFTTHFHQRRRKRRRDRQKFNIAVPTEFDLHSVSVHEHQRQLLHAKITNATSAIAAWRALGWFQATRHLSRYEYAYRKREGLDLMLRWNGFYNESTTTNTTAEDSSFFSFLPTTRNRRLVNISNWITNAGHVDTYQAVPLSQGYGTHLANVWVGSPHPQRKTVIVDTGSHFTAFPCQGCDKCGGAYHTDPYFDPLKSGKSTC